LAKQKYSIKDEELMRKTYITDASQEERDEAVLDLAEQLGNTKRSIIAKLSKMRIYKSKARTSKVTGGKAETKEQLVRRIEERLGYELEEFEGLEKAPKLVLLKLLKSGVTK